MHRDDWKMAAAPSQAPARAHAGVAPQLPPPERAALLTQLEWAVAYLDAALNIPHVDAPTKLEIGRLRRELEALQRSVAGLRIL